jgi:hypothetical protein
MQVSFYCCASSFMLSWLSSESGVWGTRVDILAERVYMFSLNSLLSGDVLVLFR